MHSIHADIEKNCLRILFKGMFDVDEAHIVAAKLLREAAKLKPNFSAVNDVREYRPANAEVAEIISHAQTELKKMGIGHVARIVEHSHVAAMQLARTARTAGYLADEVTTPEEAEALLFSKHNDPHG